MSFEVIVQEYSYLPDTNLEPVFRHNALHDMEALWWCAVWILFFLRPVDVVEDDLAKERRLSKINYIFPGTTNDLGLQGGFAINIQIPTVLIKLFLIYLGPNNHRFRG